jgi:hypothetical protein
MRIVLKAGLLAACIGTAWAAQPSLPEAEFKLEPYRKTVALHGSVRGIPGLFLFDTGGGVTLVSPEFAKKIGCEPWGRLSGHRMMGDRLDASRCDDVPVVLPQASGGTRTYRAPVTAVVDVTSFLPEGAAPVEGSIALDLFAGKTITIDFPAQRLIVESPQSLQARIAGAHELPVSLSREMQGRALAASLGVPTAKGMAWMELDTGNGGTILVSQPYADAFGLDAKQEGPQSADFEVSKDFRATGTAFTPNMILDGNLGMPFLKDKIVTLDLGSGRLWIAASSKP